MLGSVSEINEVRNHATSSKHSQSFGWCDEEGNVANPSNRNGHNTSRGHKRLRRNAASAGSIATTSLCDAHSVDIVYPKSAKGEKCGTVHFRPSIHHGSTSLGLEGGPSVAAVSSSSTQPSSLPSAAEPPSHPVSLE
ncbi:hypothetical protein SK128_019522, partial [Halocaridina rubra]